MTDVGIVRAIEGERMPVLYRGRIVGARVRHDNRLLIAVLNAIGGCGEAPLPSDDLATFHHYLALIGGDDAAIEK